MNNFLHQIDEQHLCGEHATINKNIFSKGFKPLAIGTEGVVEYALSGVVMVYEGRGILLANFKVRETIWRQPFYVSTGRATPEISKKGNIWPMGVIWDEEALKTVSWSEGLPDGWIEKSYWSQKELKWCPHNKLQNAIPGGLLNIIKIAEKIIS